MDQAKAIEAPKLLMLWNLITQYGFRMAYQKQIVLSGSAQETGMRPMMVVFNKEVSCLATQAAFLLGIRVRLSGAPSAVRDIQAATLSLHADGENIFMDEIGNIASSDGLVPILPAAGLSCLYHAKAWKEDEKSWLKEPVIGWFFPNGSLLQVRVDDFKGKVGLGAEITVDAMMGLYSLEHQPVEG